MKNEKGANIAKEDLPWLGIGVATEYAENLPPYLEAQRGTELIDFVEYGGMVEMGLDKYIRQWASTSKGRTTYHYLDVNLSDGSPLSTSWCRKTAELAREIGASWLCGDVGMWHYGSRKLKNLWLTHPILTAESADRTADAIMDLQDKTGLHCFPENPPSHFFLGDMHELDYFARLAERADCWITLDVAHLLMYQHAFGYDPLTGLDGFPMDRVGEMHVAGGHRLSWDGHSSIYDSHLPQIMEDVWQIVAYVMEHAVNLKAICLEAEVTKLKRLKETLRQLHSLHQHVCPSLVA